MVVFEKTGRENTDAALHIAIEAASSRGYGIVAASNTGETVDRLLTLMAEAGASVPVVMVGQVDGFAAPWKNALSPEMRRSLKARGVRVAVLDAPLLIQGETGTGKELVARACHAASPRSKAPFLTLSCAAVSENQADGELFGYAPGAANANQRSGKPGLLELANGGTVFLDEIAELSPYLQIGRAHV